MDMASLLSYLGQAGQNLTPSQQQQLLASVSNQLSSQNLSPSQQAQLLASACSQTLPSSQQQQLLSSPSSKNLTASQQHQMLASASIQAANQASIQAANQQATSQRVNSSSQVPVSNSQQNSSIASGTGLTLAQQKLLAAAGTSLTSLGSSSQAVQQQIPASNRERVYQQQANASSRSSTPSNETPTDTPSTTPRPSASTTPRPQTSSTPTPSNGTQDPASQTKYNQLLSVMEEMSKDIRPSYAGSKSSAERLKRGIMYARILVRECLVEADRSNRS